MNKEINFNNDTEMNLYCDLLRVAYNVYKSQNDGMICGSAAEEIVIALKSLTSEE